MSDETACDCNEVVREWLDVNSQRFTIPGSEWGRDLLGSLRCVLAASEDNTDFYRGATS